MHDAVRVLDGVESGDGEDATGFGGEGFGMFGGVVVDAFGEDSEVRAELGRLLLEPLRGAGGNAIRPDPIVSLKVGGLQVGEAEVFGGASARFTVEVEEEVAVALGLRPAVAVEEVFGGLGVDVGDTVFVPEDFGAFLGHSGGREGDEGEG